MSQLVSTVPAAVECLLGHFDTIAADNPSMGILVVFGEVIGNTATASTNLLQVTGTTSPVQRQWVTLGALGQANANPAASETYSIECLVRSWVGDATDRSNQLQSLGNAWALVDAVVAELFNDPTGGGAIGPPGSWSLGSVTTEQSELKGGWNTDLTFEVSVSNVRVAWQ